MPDNDEQELTESQKERKEEFEQKAQNPVSKEDGSVNVISKFSKINRVIPDGKPNGPVVQARGLLSADVNPRPLPRFEVEDVNWFAGTIELSGTFRNEVVNDGILALWNAAEIDLNAKLASGDIDIEVVQSGSEDLGTMSSDEAIDVDFTWSGEFGVWDILALVEDALDGTIQVDFEADVEAFFYSEHFSVTAEVDILEVISDSI